MSKTTCFMGTEGVFNYNINKFFIIIWCDVFIFSFLLLVKYTICLGFGPTVVYVSVSNLVLEQEHSQ